MHFQRDRFLQANITAPPTASVFSEKAPNHQTVSNCENF